MTPTWILERDNPELQLRRISLDCRCRLLSILVEADIRGRICADQTDLLERLELFKVLSGELGLLNQPARFASDAGRYLYFQERWHLPDQAPYEDFRCRVVMLSGLPGAGKDTWASRHYSDWPVISLDEIREKMGVSLPSLKARLSMRPANLPESTCENGRTSSGTPPISVPRCARSRWGCS